MTSKLVNYGPVRIDPNRISLPWPEHAGGGSEFSIGMHFDGVAATNYVFKLLDSATSRMNEAKARKILGSTVNAQGGLGNGLPVIGWPQSGDWRDQVLLDGDFTADTLEAIAWWMRNMPRPAT
jgi:hypothetical protein